MKSSIEYNGITILTSHISFIKDSGYMWQGEWKDRTTIYMDNGEKIDVKKSYADVKKDLDI